jgi:hypothetical protein
VSPPGRLEGNVRVITGTGLDDPEWASYMRGKTLTGMKVW